MLPRMKLKDMLNERKVDSDDHIFMKCPENANLCQTENELTVA